MYRFFFMSRGIEQGGTTGGRGGEQSPFSRGVSRELARSKRPSGSFWAVGRRRAGPRAVFE